MQDVYILITIRKNWRSLATLSHICKIIERTNLFSNTKVGLTVLHKYCRMVVVTIQLLNVLNFAALQRAGDGDSDTDYEYAGHLIETSEV